MSLFQSGAHFEVFDVEVNRKEFRETGGPVELPLFVKVELSLFRVKFQTKAISFCAGQRSSQTALCGFDVTDFSE